MHNFDLIRPVTVADAAAALRQPEAMAMGGGQTLIPTLKQRLAGPSALVSLAGIREITGVCRDGDAVAIGAATTHAAVARDAAAHYPALAALAGQIGDPAVRNRGTLGGSVANNDPAACYPAAVLASGAVVVTDRRELAADAFFQGMFATALGEGEIIREIRFPIPLAANYQKFVQPASRFALVGVMVARYAGGVRVAVTGASQNGVFRWTAAEAALSANFSPAAVSALTPPPAADMIADLHGDGRYRANLVKVMTGRAVAAAA